MVNNKYEIGIKKNNKNPVSFCVQFEEAGDKDIIAAVNPNISETTAG